MTLELELGLQRLPSRPRFHVSSVERNSLEVEASKSTRENALSIISLHHNWKLWNHNGILLSNTIKRLCLCLCLFVCVFVCHAHYSGVLSPFGKPEVSLEPYRRGHAIFQVSKNFTCVFTQFHAIFMLFGLFHPFLGQFQHVGYQKACTRAGEFNGDLKKIIWTYLKPNQTKPKMVWVRLVLAWLGLARFW